tara:strand:+ start:327 stop:1547 length:1221 start_codon:yes stop_codon:yes gene_type:complete
MAVVAKPTVKTNKKLPAFTKWDITHGALDIAGLVPVIGAPADLINAVLYGVRGKKGDALLSLVGAIPILGHITTGGKLGGKAGKAYVKHTAKVIESSVKAEKVENVGKLTKVYKKSGKLVDEFGNQVDEYGNLIDEYGNIYTIPDYKPPGGWKSQAQSNAFFRKKAFTEAAINAEKLAEDVRIGEKLREKGSGWWSMHRGISKIHIKEGYEIDFWKHMIRFRKYEKKRRMWVPAEKGSKGAKPFLVGGGVDVGEWKKMSDVLHFASGKGWASSFPTVQDRAQFGQRMLSLNVSKKFIRRFAKDPLDPSVSLKKFTGDPMVPRLIDARVPASEIEQHFAFPAGINLERILKEGYLHDIKLWESVQSIPGTQSFSSPFRQQKVKWDYFEGEGMKQLMDFVKKGQKVGY